MGAPTPWRSIGVWESDTLLWRAHHIAVRSDGEFPLGVIAAPIADHRAAALAYDPDVLPSLAQDAVRRIFAGLPVAEPGDLVPGPRVLRILP
ncbi:MAG: hypothetical protein RID42_16045 [Alphaproteobacteria bacterium]